MHQALQIRNDIRIGENALNPLRHGFKRKIHRGERDRAGHVRRRHRSAVQVLIKPVNDGGGSIGLQRQSVGLGEGHSGNPVVGTAQSAEEIAVLALL